ncbi:MAG: hypothetical protein BWY87_00148 [Deltaproteobacteria bacterium ADurb.Bin510]|nr:MAG: hypothetical protein BWY87_00148 [Deltaproteobacteria bacterium ADurb.Bin510]
MPYRQLDHEADLALEVWGANQAALLTEAALALADFMGARTESGSASVDVAVAGLDLADALVRWLQEVLYWITVRGLRLAAAEAEPGPDFAVRGRLIGQWSQAGLAREIKAVTYHGLELVESPGRQTARLVCDL